MSDDFTIDELLLAADILRSMLDDAQASNRQLLSRISTLETVLKEHGIPIPDYEVWHDDSPMI